VKEFHYEHIQFKDSDYPFVFHRGCTVNQTHNFPAHWHESVEILYFYDGECDVIIDSQVFHIHPCSILCINSEKVHCISTDSSANYNTLILSPSFIKKCGIDIRKQLNPYVKSEDILRLYRAVHNEHRNKLPYHNSALVASITLLMINLYRNHSEGDITLNNSTQKRNHLIRSCIDYIRQHYLEDISTSDISDHLGITPNHLCACFKEATGTTVKKYINALRCHDAEAMLTTQKFSVTEVALNCGFSNMAYFAKIYRSVTGENPSDTLSKHK
jgi:AraC-like DNA-binding protein